MELICKYIYVTMMMKSDLLPVFRPLLVFRSWVIYDIVHMRLPIISHSLFYQILAASPRRRDVTVTSRVFAAIGAKPVDPHSGLQVGKCRAFGLQIINSILPFYPTAHRHRSEAGRSPR